MFLKTETGTFVNVDSIQAIECGAFPPKKGKYAINLCLFDNLVMPGALYNNKEDAKYALNFLFSHIQNTRNENRMFYEIPTQDDVDIYKWADKVAKVIEASEDTEQEKRQWKI
jgi:hypothetical protein